MIQAETFAVLAEASHRIGPGELGENITTTGIDLHALGVGSVLRIGRDALLAVTGLRNPCAQIEAFQRGLLKLVNNRYDTGALIRRAGIMGIVVLGGKIRVGDRIETGRPPGVHQPLDRV